MEIETVHTYVTTLSLLLRSLKTHLATLLAAVRSPTDNRLANTFVATSAD